MKPLLLTSSMLFFLLPFFISVMIPTSLGANDDRFTNCSSTFSCGRNISNLKYPFWGDNRAEYCGLPDFHLKCENNSPHIIIQSIKYRILDFQWASQSLTLARDDYSHSICPIEYKNNSFDPTTFKYVDGVANITFHYDCTSDDVLSRNESFGENCTRDDGADVFVSYALGLVYASNCKSVIMAVFHSQAEEVAANGVQAALDNGFGLQWMVNNSQCETCSKSGGECGYNKNDWRFSCFCQDGPHKTSCFQGSSESIKKLDWRPKIAIGISAGIVGIAIISVLIICYLKKHFRIKGRRTLKETRAFHHHNLETLMRDYGSLAPKQYSYSEVKKMTKSFSDKLGQGGYGVVYKASLSDGRLVAVKVISESKGSGEEFLNEVASIIRTSHVNIVTLLGFCYERNKKVLIYEYMPNGSLDKFIYKKGSFNAICSLERMTMYQISIGVARGLEYFHRGCNTRILHFDIKPQNILLDEDFCPKISDFGLAKICLKKESVVSILGARGTVGFIAPEVFSKAFGQVSHKSDVYSYGMLVLEMVGGRKNYDTGGSLSEEMYFPDWIYRDLEQGNSFVSSLSITEEENEMVRKMILVSLWCIQTDPLDRPSMSKVVEMLEGSFQSLLFPPKPSLHSPTRSSLQFSNGSTLEILETNSVSTWKDAPIEC